MSTGGRVIRKFLDRLYAISGGLAACFLVAIAVIVLAQVSLNTIDKVSQLMTGEPVGLVIPSYADFTGFFLAAASFLALAYTLTRGEHIRVNLIIQRFSRRTRRYLEIWCTGVAALFTGYFTWYATVLTYESWEFNDKSPGIVPVPIWIPQVPLVIGLGILTIALIDLFYLALKDETPRHFLTSGDADISVDRDKHG